jgi:chaperonin cofactor prefoldin
MDDKEKIEQLEKRIEKLEDQVFDLNEENENLRHALDLISDTAQNALWKK